MRRLGYGLLAVALACGAACVPYSREEVRIPVNDDVTLAGTLSIPEGEGPFPVVVLVSGSGLQTRDHEVWGFPMFRKLADHLARRSIAVLRCDDRGFGRSTGNGSGMVNDTREFAEDVLAQVEFLKSRSEVDHARIGLLGISEGALAASMADARSPDLEFVILLAGPAVPVRQTLDAQLAATMRSKGRDEAAIAARLELWQRIWKALDRGDEMSGLRYELFDTLRKDFALKSPEEQERYGSADHYAEQVVRKEFNMFGSKWGKFLISYDPRADQSEMDSRVLALYGGKDTQVPAELNAPALERTFQKAGKTNYDIRVLDAANHLFQKAVTGRPDEYEDLPREFVPGFLEAVEAWTTLRSR